MRSLDKRLEEAACNYYDVDTDFFKERDRRTSNTERRWVLFWLLKHDALLSIDVIAQRYDYKRSAIVEGIKKIDFRKDVFVTLSRDIDAIRKMANE